MSSGNAWWPPIEDERSQPSFPAVEVNVLALDRVPVEERPGMCGPCIADGVFSEATFAVVRDYGDDGHSTSGRCDRHKDVDDDEYELKF